MRELLVKCASTALNSKLIAGQKGFFSEMVVDAVMSLDELLPLKMIGIKKVQGGALEVRNTAVLFLTPASLGAATCSRPLCSRLTMRVRLATAGRQCFAKYGRGLALVQKPQPIRVALYTTLVGWK